MRLKQNTCVESLVNIINLIKITTHTCSLDDGNKRKQDFMIHIEQLHWLADYYSGISHEEVIECIFNNFYA